MFMGLLLLRLVSETCQMSTSARVSIECHWLAYTGNHLAGVQWGLLVGYFTLKNAKLSCNKPLRGSHPYISACGVDKNYLKWREIQLAMHCGEGSLIDLK